MRRLFRVLMAVVVGVAATSQAQIINPGSGSVVKPRVFVIFDTSTSMKEAPDYLSSFGFYGSDDTSTDPDVSPVPDTSCRSKFCIAKKTVYEVLKTYVADDIRLGLSSYYQYLVKYDPIDSRLSKCWYDAMWKPGQKMFLPRDGTGTLADSNAFPIASAGADAGVVGADLSNANTLVNGVSNQGNCRPGSATYNLAIEATGAPVTRTCNIYNRPNNPGGNITLPGSGVPTPPGCNAGRTYGVTGFSNYDNNSGAFYRWRIPAASSCPANVPSSADYSAAAFMNVAAPGTNTALCGSDPYATNCWEAAPFGASPSDSCSSNVPCRMYSASSGAETNVTAEVNWIAGFNGACNPDGGTYATPDPNPDSNTTTNRCAIPSLTTTLVPAGFNQPSRVQTATGVVLQSVVQEGVGGTCNGLLPNLGLGTIRYTSGNIGNFIAGTTTRIAPTTSGALSGSWQDRARTAIGGFAANTVDPQLTGDCTSMACDVALTARTQYGNSDVIDTVNTCTPVAAAPPAVSVTCNDGAAPDTMRRILKSGPSCPSVAGPYGSAAAVAAAGNWQTTGWHATCTAGDSCSFVPSAMTEEPGTIPSCNNTSRFDGTTPANCSYLGLNRAYTPGGPQNFSVRVDKSPGSTCGDTVATMSFVGTNAAATTALTACLGGGMGACNVTAPMTGVSPSLDVASSLTSNSPPVATPPYGSRVEVPLGTYYDRDPAMGGCTAQTNGTFYNLDGLNLIFRVGTGPGGATQVGTVGETPIFKCRFERVRVEWSRPLVRCTYTLTRVDFTVDNTLTWCRFDQKRIQRITSTPVYACTYEVPVQRFTFQRPNHKVCNYFRTRLELQRDAPNVRYSYQTLGGEFIGSYFTEFPAVDAVSAAYGDFSGSCAPVVDDCYGAGTVCYLRNTTNTQTAQFDRPGWTRLATSGAVGTRYSNFSNTNAIRPLAPSGSMINVQSRHNAAPSAVAGHSGVRVEVNAAGTYGAGYGCRAADYATPPVAPPGTRQAFAAFNGAVLSPPQYKLVSDYLDCTDENNPATCQANNISALNTDPRAAALSLNPSTLGAYAPLTNASWTAGATKAFGASTAGSAYTSPSLQLMDFPADNDADGDLLRFKQLMSQCYRPHPTNANGLVTWPAAPMSASPLRDRTGAIVDYNSLGLCFADTGAPNSAGINDFTPLYGSLRNVKKYLEKALETDNNHSCRKYFVVLATDGAENTPKNTDYKNVTALTNAVTSLRTTTSSNGRTTDVNTFVLGFGDALVNPTEAYNLDQMALAGNTGGAYFAANRADLAVRLAQIFNTITKGTYSRSRPVITTDGRGLYLAYYDVQANSAEWVGHFAAVDFDSGGNQVLRWNLADKLNNGMSDTDRNLYTMVGGTRRQWNLTNAGIIEPLLNTDADYYGGPGYTGPTTATNLNPNRIIRFVRNLAKVTGNATSGEDYFQTGTPDKRLSRYAATVKSFPVIVGKSTNGPEWGGRSGTTSRTSYAAFQATTASRETRVIIGASDGVLRGIRDRTGDTACQSSGDAGVDDTSLTCPNGKEAWGFIPEALHPVLYKNTTGYNPGVDGESWLEDICVLNDADDCVASDWRTIVIKGMRGGGRGIEAFDVTDPNDPKSMWSFDMDRGGSQMAYPVTAAIGRVEVNGNKDRYIAVMPGGFRNKGIYGDLSDANGDEIYVFNAATGTQLEFFNSNGDDDCTEDDSEEILGCEDLDGEDNQFIAKPSYFRRLGSPYMDNMVYSGTSGLVYITRFRKKVKVEGNGTVKVDARDSSNRWEPERFFDPTNSNTDKSPTGSKVRVRRVINTAGVFTQADCSPASFPGYQTCGELPLAANRRLPLHNRPRAAPIYDTAGLTADYYFGTGDTLSPVEPGPRFRWNYVYGIHDGNNRDDGRDDAQPLWVNQLINEYEQVVTEPLLINGNLIVTTYLPPPPTASDCTEPGAAYLYCFNPKSGDLVQCLVEGGTRTSVRALGNIGIATTTCSGATCYTLGSNSPPGGPGLPPRAEQTPITPPVPSGDTRSFRRVR